jgi:hypothetical protein
MILGLVFALIIGAPRQDSRSTEPQATMKQQAHDEYEQHKQSAIRISELAGRIQSEADASAVVSEIAALFAKELPPAWASGSVRQQVLSIREFAPAGELPRQRLVTWHYAESQNRSRRSRNCEEPKIPSWLWLRPRFHALDKGAMNREQCACALQYFDVFLVEGVSGELGAVDFIFGERGKVDETDGFIGGSGKICRHEISENLAPAFAYGNLLIGAVFRDVRQLVGVNRVAQKKCDQGECLPGTA